MLLRCHQHYPGYVSSFDSDSVLPVSPSDTLQRDSHMLNYIWMGLIAIGIFVAVGNDVRDEVVNPYRNGMALTASLEIEKTPAPLRSSYEGTLVIPAAAFNSFYGVSAA